MRERSSMAKYFLASIALVISLEISIPLLSSKAMAQETKVNDKEEKEPLTRIFEPRDFVGSNKVPLEYPGVQHDSWTATYANPDFYQWLFAQQRTEN